MTRIIGDEKKEAKNAIGKLIRMTRRKKNMTQVKFSELTGISNEQICRIESGTIRPSVAYLESMAPYLAKSLDELLELSGYMGSLRGKYNYTIVDGKERIYMDTSGNSIDITNTGLKIYNKNPILFTLLNENIEKLSEIDIELLILILQLVRKEVSSNADSNGKIKKAVASLKVFAKDFLSYALEG